MDEFVFVTFEKGGFEGITEAEQWVEKKIAENATETEIVEDVTYEYKNGKWRALLSLSNEG